MIQDDRTPEQKATHTVVIGGTDRFMSGWGGAAGGTSVAGWACKPEDAHTVYRWVEDRSAARFSGRAALLQERYYVRRGMGALLRRRARVRALLEASHV